MPFDGGEFSQSPEPSPSGTALASFWTWLVWVQPLLLVGLETCGYQSLDSAVRLLHVERGLIEAEENQKTLD